MVQPVILAGGNGTRLWPMSRTAYPKQFHPFDNSASLFQSTVMRFSKDPIVICNEAHRFIVKEQLDNLERSGTIVLEEKSCNTAPAIATIIQECSLTDIVAIMPSDHYIENESVFVTAIARAKELAKQGLIVTLGIEPTYPSTGYGYILPHGDMVEKFVEKPNEETAKQFINDGYLWNSGIFVVKVSTLLELYQKHCPHIISAVSPRPTDSMFKRYEYNGPSVPFDTAIMEKTDIAAVVGVSCGWNDVGSWDSYLDVVHDADGNHIDGNVTALETSNTLVKASKRKVCTLGVDDLIIVDTNDALLIAHRDYSQQVKELVTGLPSELTDSHLEVHRPWGSYETIAKGPRHQVKRLSVKPSHKLSLQLHHHRSEHWVVVSGTAEVTISDKEFIVTEGESVYIPLSEVHSLKNPGKIPLEIIEVQTGSYLGEDDIVRLEDAYGRK